MGARGRVGQVFLHPKGRAREIVKKSVLFGCMGVV